MRINNKPIPKRIFTAHFFFVDINQTTLYWNNPSFTPSGYMPLLFHRRTLYFCWKTKKGFQRNQTHTHTCYIRRVSDSVAVQMCQSNHPPDELDLLPSFSASSICVGNRFKKLPCCVVFPSDDSSSSVHVFFSTMSVKTESLVLTHDKWKKHLPKRDLIEGRLGLVFFFFSSATTHYK